MIVRYSCNNIGKDEENERRSCAYNYDVDFFNYRNVWYSDFKKN